MSESVIDPVKFLNKGWPHLRLYGKQEEIVYSVKDNDETLVPAGHMLGKDFIAAFIAVWWVRSRRPARVVTTSVKESQLNDVLWGEIRRFLNTCEFDLGLHYNHMKIRQLQGDGKFADLTELVGEVCNKNESLFGRHLDRDIPRTLIIFDEASGIDQRVYDGTDTWAHHKLIIGNPYPCNNFFYKGVKAGDLKAPKGDRYYRKIIRIKAEDSPNVRAERAAKERGEKPDPKDRIPGLIDLEEYEKRRSMWDPVRQCIGLDAEFYEGAENLLYPPEWLNHAEQLATALIGRTRIARAIGIDPAEGGDSTVYTVVDDLGIIEQISKKTPDTSVIMGDIIALSRKYNVAPQQIFIDRGGGGYQHANYLRKAGFEIKTVSFGEAATPEKQRGVRSLRQRRLDEEARTIYKNRRAEMYGILSYLLDPTQGGFAIPAHYEELRRQLSPIRRDYDGEGKLWLPSKHKKPNSTEETMEDLIGCSPDEVDSLVLAVFGMVRKPRITTVGAMM